MSTLKDSGNEAFHAGAYSKAIALYTEALTNVADIDNTTRFHCYLNRALAYLQLEQFADALIDTDAGLALQPSSTKALYRRALALNGIGQYREALGILVNLCKKDSAQASLYTALIQRIHRHQHDPAHQLASGIMKNSDRNLIVSDLRKLAALVASDPNEAAKLSKMALFVSHLFNQACDSCKTSNGNDLAELSLALLQQIIRTDRLAAGSIPTNQLPERVEGSGFSSIWLSFLGTIVKSDLCFDLNQRLFSTLRHGLDSQQDSGLDVDRCSRILSTACDIAMSSAERLKQIRADLLPSVVMLPRNARFTSDLLKLIAILSECQVSEKLDSEHETDSAQLAVPSPEFVALVQKSVDDLLTKSESTSTGLSALALVLAAVPAVTSSLVAESTRLSLLLEIASGDDELQGGATAVLALASSDVSVRKAISEADFSYLFVDALDSEDHLVAAYACLALSKLAINNESVRSDILQSHIALERACDLLNETERSASRVCQVSIEAIMYLSNFKETKIAFITRAELLTKFTQAATFCIKESSSRYAIAQIIASLSTSTDDFVFDAEMDSEKAKLKDVASKVIPGQEPVLDLSKVAGSFQDINRLKIMLLDSGAGRILADSVIFETPSRRSDLLEAVVAKAFTRLSSVISHCGRLVSDGALAAMLSIIHNSGTMHTATTLYNARLTIARLCIRTNPALIGNKAQSALPKICLTLVEEAKHELHEYEGLLALTNAASVNEEIRNQIMGLKGWQRLLMCLSSNNELIQSAALEVLVNLIPCQSAMDRFANQKHAAEQDIKIFLMFSRSSENSRMIAAALAGLAMMSDQPKLAEIIINLGGFDTALQLSNVKDCSDIEIRASVLLGNLKGRLNHNNTITTSNL